MVHRLLCLLGGAFLVLLAYVALALMLEKQPVTYSENIKTQHDHTLKSKPWKKGQSPEQLLSVLERDFDRIDGKIRNIAHAVDGVCFTEF